MSDFGPKRTGTAPRGRPKKKPDFDREKEIQELVEQALTLFCIPFDDRKERPPDAPSIRDVAKEMDSTTIRIRKLLITADYYSTVMSRRVQTLSCSGYSIQQIMKETGLNQTSVYSYLPYNKGAYNLKDPTLYAERCRRFRSRKKAQKALEEHLDAVDCCGYLWNAILAFQDFPFQCGKRRIKYKVQGDWILGNCFKLSRQEVEAAFQRTLETQRSQGCVTKECLGCDKAEELLTVFLRIGACKKKC